MRRPDRRALFGAGLLMITPAPGRPAPSAATTPAPRVEPYATLPVARLTEWLRPRPGEAVEARVRRLERELRRMELRTLPPSAAAAVAGALRAMDFADEWEDAARIVLRTVEALAENAEDFSDPGWAGTRATLVLAWWASRGQSSRNAAETMQAYLRALLIRGSAPESEYQGLAIRAALEAARRAKTPRGENWILRRALWMLGREPGPVGLSAYLRAALHAAGGLNDDLRLFVLEGFADRLLRGGLLHDDWAWALRQELLKGEQSGSIRLAGDHLAAWFEKASLRGEGRPGV
jgi:hypothetical protein